MIIAGKFTIGERKMMKDFQAMAPREVEAYLRQVILRALGDAVENSALVWAVRGGYYNVHLTFARERTAEFKNFRKSEVPRIAKAIRALGSK